MSNVVELLKTIALKDEVTKITICISDFTSLMTCGEYNLWDPCTQLDLLKLGLYGHAFGKEIYVAKGIKEGEVKLFTKSDNDWTIPIRFDYVNEYEKFISLKAFW
jgi:hypothetical protein